MVKLTLDKVLEKQNVSRYELAKRTDIQYHVIDNYYKNKVIKKAKTKEITLEISLIIKYFLKEIKFSNTKLYYIRKSLYLCHDYIVKKGKKYAVKITR